jgi:hypothetical protein
MATNLQWRWVGHQLLVVINLISTCILVSSTTSDIGRGAILQSDVVTGPLGPWPSGSHFPGKESWRVSYEVDWIMKIGQVESRTEGFGSVINENEGDTLCWNETFLFQLAGSSKLLSR